MDFLNSLSQVAKNQKNFKKWEDNQHDEQAQREELARRRAHTQAELKQAEEFGKTIIDVVDIMDNHSENVAENVETAIDPLSSMTTLLAFIGGNWLVGKKSTQKLTDKIWEIKRNARESEEGKVLEQKLYDYYKKIGKDNRYYSILNKNDIKKVKDPVLKKELFNFRQKVTKQTGKIGKQIFRNHGLVALASIGVFIAATIFEAKLQTDSSKIARYQARRELDDPKAFVNYTPEQIAAAKNELEEHPELLKQKKNSKLKSGMIKSIYNIIKDNRAYRKDKQAREDNSQIVTRELTPEELKQAQRDKEVIQRVVRIINNEAEKNSENMEVAANVIIGATPILGATVGAGTGWVLNKLGFFDKFIKNTVDKYGSDEAKRLFKELKASKKTGLAYLKQWGEFSGSLMDSVNGKHLKDTINKAGKNKKTNFNEIIKKLFAAGFSHKTGKKWILSGIGGVVTGFAGMLIGLKLQKSAARAGRYAAKRELEKNPENFIGYTPEDYEEVKDVKNTEKKPNKIKEYALFIPNVLKQYWDYNKYKKTEYKERQALRDILKKQDITEEQLRDAKNLQRKVFNTFEKVDDNSQVYSESMEAAAEIAQPFVWYGGILVAASPAIITGIQVARGKITAAKLTEKITNFLSIRSNMMQKKWFKKYLKGVENNITKVVNNVNMKQDTLANGQWHKFEIKPLGALLNGIDIQKDPIIDIFSKLIKNADIGTEKFKQLTNFEQTEYLYEMKNRVLKNFEMFDDTNPLKQKISNLFDILINGHKHNDYNNWVPMNSDVRADIIDYFKAPAKLTPERAETVIKTIEAALGKDTAEMIAGNNWLLNEMSNSIKIKDLNKLTADLEQNIRMRAQESDMYFPLNRKMIEILQKYLGKEEFNKLLSKESKFNIEEFLKPKTAGLVKPEGIPDFAGIYVDEALDILHAVKDKVRKTTFKDLYNLLPEKYINQKTALTSLKNKVSKMTPEEFEGFASDSLKMSSMDKETFLRIIPKIEKILENIPKEEFNKITSKIIKEFNEHPDEFMKLVQSGQLGSILMTPELQKTLAVAGISWTAFTIIMTYAVESWLADMQLKAGRLGVMKAMESLEDPRYYANIEPTSQAKTQQPKSVENSSDITSSGNLLDKFKK